MHGVMGNLKGTGRFSVRIGELTNSAYSSATWRNYAWDFDLAGN